MKRLGLLIIVWGVLVSCAGLPELHKTEGQKASDTHRACRELYPSGVWQLVHTIQAELPGSQKGFLMGVTRLSSKERSIRAVIMTLEGFVVFNGEYDGTIRVERAVSPFDNDAFARGVMADIHLMFFEPLAHETQTGSLADDTAVCRYGLDDGTVMDVLQLSENQWETRLYDPNHRLKRLVTYINDNKGPSDTSGVMADKIELTVRGTPGYKLIFDLVEAIPLETE